MTHHPTLAFLEHCAVVKVLLWEKPLIYFPWQTDPGAVVQILWPSDSQPTNLFLRTYSKKLKLWIHSLGLEVLIIRKYAWMGWQRTLNTRCASFSNCSPGHVADTAPSLSTRSWSECCTEASSYITALVVPNAQVLEIHIEHCIDLGWHQFIQYVGSDSLTGVWQQVAHSNGV